MPRTALTITDVPKPTATAGVAVTVNTADATDENNFVLTGREIVILYNTHADTAKAFDIDSARCSHGRSNPVSAFSLDPVSAEMVAFAPEIEGWRQTDGKVWIDPESTDVKILVLRLP